MTMYEGSGERIDTRLSKQFSYSRSFFHHIIARGGVQVNGKVIKKSYQLKNNDQIDIDDVSRYLSPIILDEAPNIKIPVLLEKEDYLIINKPKGVLSHPKTVREVHAPSVVGFLYHTYKDLPTIGNFIRAGILHRLDKNTDGLMIIAKTEKGLEHFKKLFQTKSESKNISEKEQTELKKFYKAISYFTPEGKKFTESIHEFPYIIEEPVIAKLPHTTPKIGITKIMEIQTVTSNEGTVTKNSSLVKIFLEILTGRTHQIRYHLAHHGLPIVGDYLYGDSKETEPMQLTAYKLIFRDPEGEIVTVEI
ncbi:MAG: RluA family pseudouridine synthase [Candidatus Absconditabacterales bacterium]